MDKTTAARMSASAKRDVANVKKVFEEQFGAGILVDMEVRPGHDHDGDPVLWITYVVEDTTALDIDTVISMVRRLRERLETEAFPMPMYVDRAELEAERDERV